MAELEDMRLTHRPGEVIDRGRLVTFTFNGRAITGFEGDTIASALAANGVRLMTRSFKYHRPRGIMTADWADPNLMMQVDDEPNVRAGHRLISKGMRVSSQDAWPSVEFDVKAVNSLIGRFLAPGFYYKTFIRPQRLWPVYETVLKQFVHAGRVDIDSHHRVSDKEFAHPDVLVAGGGPAGMQSALAAANSGSRVLLVDEHRELGGHWAWAGPSRQEALASLRREVERHPHVRVLTDAVALGRYDDNWVGVLVRDRDGHERLLKARAKVLLAAPGLIERPYVFAGNDLPGVMLATTARRLINLYAVKPGRRAVVFTANAHGDACVEELRGAGVEVQVVDARAGEGISRAEGKAGVSSVLLSDGRRYDADLLVIATGWTAPTTLINMAGDRPEYDPTCARFFPSGDLPSEVLATGGLAGDGDDAQLLDHAGAVGREAARRAGRLRHRWWDRPTQPDGARPPTVDDDAAPIPTLPRDPHLALFRSDTAGFVDFSEDVKSSDIEVAVREGYSSAELAKRYTTATMGPLQGKLETINTIAVIAEATGSTIADTGTTTWRPPYAPTTLGALAGRAHDPVRRSALQEWHEQHGARPLVAGAWIRPEHYGDPAAEVRNVRENVGIIDVTPIGKLDLRGRDVSRLLQLLYTNKWQRLEVGHVRYGAMCNEDGVVLDDGVTGRLGENHYLMSTTSGGAAGIWEWVENWLQTAHPDWEVHCVPVTTAYTSINVAGPRSRELLGRLTDIDLDPEAFPYMRVRTGTVAGVADVVVWRIGFTGELSYELHVPAAYGLHVWTSLLETGADLGAAPFGVEAQRVLRLEKGHLIVGQDTDGLTLAQSAGLDWAVKLDKDDFVGAPELRWQAERAPLTQLVALRPVDPDVVPAEASQIVDARRQIIGRITSSRRSPTLGHGICLGQILTEHSTPGTTHDVLLPNGSIVRARVCESLAQVDPEGGRARA